MAEYTNSAGVPSLNAALMHTLQRHRDILQVTNACPSCFYFVALFGIIISSADITACLNVLPEDLNATDPIALFLSLGTPINEL